jgi:hypothetical protein
MKPVLLICNTLGNNEVILTTKMEAMRRMMRKDESAYIRASKTRNSIGNRFEDKATSRRFLWLTPSVEDIMLPSNHY